MGETDVRPHRSLRLYVLAVRRTRRRGRLDGKRTTTHWSQAAEIAKRFPGVKLEPHRLFTKDGSVGTSAEVTADIDGPW